MKVPVWGGSSVLRSVWEVGTGFTCCSHMVSKLLILTWAQSGSKLLHIVTGSCRLQAPRLRAMFLEIGSMRNTCNDVYFREHASVAAAIYMAAYVLSGVHTPWAVEAFKTTLLPCNYHTLLPQKQTLISLCLDSCASSPNNSAV